MQELFAPLDAHAEPIPFDLLRDWVGNIELRDEDVNHFVRFHPEHYLRNLMHAGPTYHALLLCWQAGQRSPIHDHTGSACAVKVLRGTATETRFEHAPNGMVYATDSRTLATGGTCGSFDTDIHQVSNLQADDAELITLHVYSPPLLSMNVYSMFVDSVSPFLDPINDEFVGGAGI